MKDIPIVKQLAQMADNISILATTVIDSTISTAVYTVKGIKDTLFLATLEDGELTEIPVTRELYEKLKDLNPWKD